MSTYVYMKILESALAFSEMSEEEQAYVVAAAHRVLRPGGRVVIADEVRPRGLAARLVHALVRWPLAVLTYVVTQTSTPMSCDVEGVPPAGRRRPRPGSGETG